VRPKVLAITLLLLFTLMITSVGSQAEVRAGLSPQSLTVPSTEEVRLNVTIFSGGSRVKAGEFNISYPPDCLSLIRVDGLEGWNVVNATNRYVFITLGNPANETAVAVIRLKPKEVCAGKQLEVNLLYFKASDGEGKNLSVVLSPSVASVTIILGEEAGGGTTIVTVVRKGGLPLEWLLALVAVAVAGVTAVVAFSRVRQARGYYLLDAQGRVLLKGRKRDYTYGREDFVSLIPQQLLQYITRKAKGGQFRIFAYGNAYYIEDRYSTNPTIVDGVNIRGRGPVPLRDGSVITLPGGFQLVFRLAGG